MGGLIINYDTRTREEKMAEKMYELDATWCLTEDQSTAVPEGHPDARFVLGGPGKLIPLADAVKYGLSAEPPPDAEPEEPPAVELPAEPEKPAEPAPEPVVEPPAPEAKAARSKTKA